MEMKKIFTCTLVLMLLLVGLPMSSASAATCTQTGFFRDSINLTAAVINPSSVSGTVDATGCNIGVYINSGKVTVDGATIFGANYFGVVNDGANVTIKNSSIHDIGENPLNGTQHGVAVYFAFGSAATGSITGNDIRNYQKGGIVVNGVGSSADIKNNTVTGQGPVAYIAQNGIQVGYGANAMVQGNTVTGNSYTGSSTASGGIIVVGGPCYGGAYTVGTRIMDNVSTNNDVGIWLSNIDADCITPPGTATNIKVVNNVISSDGLHNGIPYQAGIADQGNNDKLIHNTISGPGYDPNANPGVFSIDADPSFTNRPKVHANVINP
jgi:hypothetical protein